MRVCVRAPCAGKAVWKLDDPQALRAEQAERARQAAEAALKKLEGALERKVRRVWVRPHAEPWISRLAPWPRGQCCPYDAGARLCHCACVCVRVRA